MLNSGVSLIFQILSILIQFVARKVFLDYLGTEILGLNTTVQNLLQLLNIAELGIGTAISFTLFKPLAENNKQEISEISRSLKILAKELNVPVIALSQLSRAVEQRPDHKPMMSDLRESGSIEQDADIVMFLYREDYYNPDTERKNIAEVIIGKNRSGSTGSVDLGWLGSYTKFVNLEKRFDD